MTEIVAWRLANKDEIPTGAQRVANAATKAGWIVLVGYSRGPWMGNDGEDKVVTEEGAADEAAIVEMITVQGRKTSAGKRFVANWHRKLWTKPGRDGDYGYAGATMQPPVAGAVYTTKAKKDRHPESLEEATIGGLKGSKTLTAYLKEN